MHFLSGYAWQILWVWVSVSMSTTHEISWLSLYLLMLVGFLFELVENNPTGKRLMWSCFGYDDTSYPGDSATNAISDMLFVLLGWTVVELMVFVDHSMVMLVILLSVGFVLLLMFVYLLRLELRVQRGGTAQAVAISARSVPPLFVGR